MISALFGQITKLKVGREAPHYVALDNDDTLIDGDCGQTTLHYLARHDIGNARNDFHYYYSLIDDGEFERAYRFNAEALHGLSVAQVDGYVKLALQEEGTTIGTARLLGRNVRSGVAVRKGMREFIEALRLSNIDVVVVSASPRIVVCSTLHHFGIKVTKVIGVRNVIEGSYLTKQLLEPVPMYDGKADCIREHVHSRVMPLAAIGNSWNDLKMLELAAHSEGIAAVVDHNNSLSDIARQRGWPLLN